MIEKVDVAIQADEIAGPPEGELQIIKGVVRDLEVSLSAEGTRGT